jgi:hypothetical protein
VASGRRNRMLSFAPIPGIAGRIRKATARTMGIFASALFESTGAKHAALAVAIALVMPGPSARADRVNVPTCKQFIDYGRNWIGLDAGFVSRALGLPLYELTNDDIDGIAQAMKRCLAAATTSDDKAILTDELKRVRSLTAMRDRVRHAFAAFESAKKQATPKLQQITAKLDSLKGSSGDRAAFVHLKATISGIYFDLDEKRKTAQVSEPLAESFKPYMDAVDALARKRRSFAETARSALVAEAEEAVGTYRAEFEKLNVPEVSQDAAIVLEGADAGADIRWLTLRQWASLVLKNAGAKSLSQMRGDDSAAPALVAFKLVRPGYREVIFSFRQDGRDLRLVRTRVGGVLHQVDTPDDRQQAISLLISVAKSH